MQSARFTKQRALPIRTGAQVLGAAVSIIISACGAPPPPVSPEPPPPEVAPTTTPESTQAVKAPAGSIEAMAAAAKWVVAAKVGRQESKWVAGKIVTTSALEPISILKGENLPSPISVLFLGGAVGPIRQDFSGEITAVAGETAVFFLVPPPAGSGPGLSELQRIAYKIPLLKPGEADSRLKNNRRLVRFQNEIAEKVRKGAN